MVNLQRINFIGEVPLLDKDSGKTLAMGRVEKTKSGRLITHVDVREMPWVLARGFSLGEMKLKEKTE